MQPLILLRTRPFATSALHSYQNHTLHSSRLDSYIRERCGNSSRHSSFEAGDNKTGHILAAPNQTVLFFTNVFPLRLRLLFSFMSERLKLGSIAPFKPQDFIEQALSRQTNVHVDEVFSRPHEGGAFIKLSHAADLSDFAIEQIIKDRLRKSPIRLWWSPLQRVHTGLVRGRPWVEDLHRPASCRLRVEFEGGATDKPELSQEQLYSVFRPYGKLNDIIPQPSDSKDLPRFAYLDFANTRNAIMARNCLHGFLVKNESSGEVLAKLMISYQRRAKVNWIKDWIVNHPRIVIPILAALAAALTVAIFDPIRTLCIKMHIIRTSRLSDNGNFSKLLSMALNAFSFRSHRQRPSGMEAFEENRKESIEKLQRWLMESTDTFIVVQGPRGTGKKELVVDEALQDRKFKLVMDCKPIQEAHGDRATINAMAQQIGYWPVFSWLNSFNSLIDLAAQGATGMKTGFSETLDIQMAKILNNTATALKNIALIDRAKDDGDASMDDDVYLEAHPERRPVVVIDNFLHRSQEGSIIYEKLAEWAAQVTVENVAHVIFLTTDVSFAKSLDRALPGRVFRQLSLQDAGLDAAKRFVISRLSSHPGSDSKSIARSGPPKLLKQPDGQEYLDELEECISYLGGRMTDLEFLARRIKAGETPKKAVGEIIVQSASEVLKMYLSELGNGERKWTVEQAWVIISKLAEHGSVRYNEISLADTFDIGNYESVIQALEQAELITIMSQNGRPIAIKPSRPVYGSAFRSLAQDVVLNSRFNMAILSSQIKGETAKIEKNETELKLLGQLPKQPPELMTRIHYILRSIRESQSKIEEYERKIGILKELLQSEF